MSRMTSCLLSVLFVAGSMSGQERTLEQRRAYHLFTSYEVMGDVAGTVSSGNGESQPVPISYRERDQTGAIDAPFEVPGGIEWLRATASRKFLLCGSNGLLAEPPQPEGVLVLIEVDSGAGIQFDSTVVLPGYDLLAVSWTSDLGVLFVVNGIGNSLEVAPWAGPAAPLPVSGDFAVLYSAAELPVLAKGPIALQPIPGGVRVLDRSEWRGSDVVFDGATWGHAPYDPGSGGGSPPSWRVENARSLDATLPFSLESLGSPHAAPYQIVALFEGNAFVVADGLHPGRAPVQVTPPALFRDLPGWRYAVVGSQRRDMEVRPVIRYGDSADAPAVAVDQDLFLPAAFFHLGVQRFFAPRAVFHRAAGMPQGSLNGWLLAQPRIGGDDPIVELGGGIVTLEDPAITPFTIEVAAGKEVMPARVRVDVPDDQQLEGLTVFFQLLLEDGTGGLAVTSVGGIALQPRSVDPVARLSAASRASDDGGAMRALSDFRQLSRRTDRDPAVRAAAASWLPATRDRELRRSLRERLVRQFGR